MVAQRRMSEKWNRLEEDGQVPETGEGQTAERAEQDKKRKRRRMPSEDRRMGRKISPTLSRELVQRLREICKAEGYVGDDGEGVIASEVIEVLLRAGVRAYESGLIKRVTVVERREVLQLVDAPSTRVMDGNEWRRYLQEPT